MMKVFTQNRDQTVAVLFIIIFAFLLLFTTRAAQQTRDSLVYAFSARTGQELFHPHHLIFTPVIHLFFLALSSIHGLGDAILAGQIHNILWAMIAAASFFLILKHLSVSTLFSSLATILLLVTRGFWELSTQTTMYISAMGVLALLVAILIVRREAQLAISKILVIALLFALSGLYHQANVLFCLPLGYYIIAIERKRGLNLWLTIVSIAGVIVLASYILAFLSVNDTWSVGEFLRFCLAYTSEICFSGQCAVTPDTWGTSDNLGVVGVRSLLDSLLWNFVISPESLINVVILVFALFLAILYIWNVRQILNHGPYEKIRGFLLIWSMTYMLFFFWWLPDYQHPFVIVLFPTLLLAFLALKDVMDWLDRSGGWPVNSNSVKTTLAATIVLVITLISARNFQARIFPLHQPINDSYLEASELVALASPQECVIFTSYRVWNHLRYYFDKEEQAIQAKYPLSYFYQGKTLPEMYRLEEETCVLISASYIMPDYTVPGYNPSGSNGYIESSKWLAYITWLFDLEYDSKDVVIASRKMNAWTSQKRKN